jgi:hypothetical protein
MILFYIYNNHLLFPAHDQPILFTKYFKVG